MEEINVTSATRALSGLLDRAACQGARFELKPGGKSIARLACQMATRMRSLAEAMPGFVSFKTFEPGSFVLAPLFWATQ